MAKYIAQLIIAGGQVVARAFARAVKQEIEASQDAARRLGNTRSRSERVANQKVGISLEEAKQILNVSKLTREEVDKRYDNLFKANEKTNGGTLYIQSKIVRAKERMDLELNSAEPENSQKPKEESANKT